MCFLQLKCRFSGSGGFSIWGGSPSQGVLHFGGVLHPRGVSIQGGSSSGGVLHPGGLHLGGLQLGVSPSGGSPLGGVPCDLSHHAFDVTCMLPSHQLRHTNCAPAYILPGHVTCNASWDTHPPPWTDRHL